MVANVVLVTGGSRGIGAAVCVKLAQEGFDVAVNYVSNLAAAEKVVSQIETLGQKGLSVQADVQDHKQVEAMFKHVEEKLGKLYGLVNNAGITGRASTLVEADPSTLERTVRINLLGTMYCTREALKYMTVSGSGAIVNVSSGAATLGSAGEFTWYAATKAAVDCFTYGVAQEVANQGIRINCVAPGLTDTELHELSTGESGRIERLQSAIPMRRAATVEEIADPIVYLMKRQGPTYVTGAVLRTSGGR